MDLTIRVVASGHTSVLDNNLVLPMGQNSFSENVLNQKALTRPSNDKFAK